MLLIDGYNLMAKYEWLQTAHPSTTGELRKRREQFLSALAIHLELYSGEVTVVFDNAQQDFDFALQQRFHQLKLIFTPRGEEADQRIVQMVRRSSTPRQIQVVTSDREIQQNVKPHGVSTISSEDFLQTWMVPPEPTSELEKRNTIHLTASEVEGVLQEQGAADLESLSRQIHRTLHGPGKIP